MSKPVLALGKGVFSRKRNTPPHVPLENLLKSQRARLALQRLGRFPFFSQEDYLRKYPDVVGRDPLLHFIEFGWAEGRVPSANLIARTLGGLLQAKVASPPQATVTEGVRRVGVLCSSLGNRFMREIADALAHCLTSAGAAVSQLDENANIATRPEHCIYVAPHEFFKLGRGPQWIRDDVLETATMYCTEQVQTQWFWGVLPLILMARSVIDMSPQMASAFRTTMPAQSILPAVVKKSPRLTAADRMHPLLAGQKWWMPPDTAATDLLDYDKRPLDVCFFGADSPARSQFFWRHAEAFSAMDAFLYLRKRNVRRVLTPTRDGGDLTAIADYVCAHSRITLNIHRDEFSYFEWHRMIAQGAANGSLIVSEPCFPVADFAPDVHFLTEDARHMPDLLMWLLKTDDGRAKALKTIGAATAKLLHAGAAEQVGRRLMNALQG